ncbi:MAG: Spy/CpxP family protein refolding chaperone [Legionellaceae bacterium]|nr:Spy/CpxP family protein refolding chaperone [Legionellaceae bacterium]
MTKYVPALVLSSLVLTMGIAQTSFVYANDCNKQEYQALLKIKNPDVLHRIKELNLTTTQKNQFKAMKANFDAEIKKFVKSIKSIEITMNKIVASPTLDQTQLENSQNDLKKKMITGQSQTATFRHNLYNLLNDTQKAKYHELQQQERQAFRMGLECPTMDIKANPDLDPMVHINELRLTEEQKSKIMPLITANRDQEKKLLLQFDDGALSIEQMEIQFIQSTSAIDATKLNDFATAQANNIAEFRTNRLMTYREIYAALNPQQQAKFMEILNNWNWSLDE